jgi:uncharacterized protein (TIGR01777 family)
LIVRPQTAIKVNRKVIRWDIDRGEIDLAGLEGHDAVIHLAGANLAERRWTEGFKQIIKDSRVKSTTFLSEALTRLRKPPAILLTASAVGFYGNAEHDEEFNELSPKGDSFLSQVCDLWERVTEPVKKIGIRVVHMRMGMVLGQGGGALTKILPIFKLGLGGKLGTGQQIISWISVHEIPFMVGHILNTQIAGAVNFVSPQPVSNTEFTKTLAQLLHRPAIFPVPHFAVRLMFGEMADELLLGGAKIMPRRFLDTGYEFAYPDLKKALEYILYKNPEK